MKYLVKASNGCGDHVAALIDSKTVVGAVLKAVTLPGWPQTWDIEAHDYLVGTKSIFNGRPWLLDFEEFNHEEAFGGDCRY